VLASGLGGCADLLDIPSHPRLTEAVPADPGQAEPGAARSPDEAREPTAEPEGGGSLGAELGVDGRVGKEESVLPPVLNTVGASGSESGAASGERPDAGVAPPDATPVAVDPSPAIPCADVGSVGPNDSCYVPVSTSLTWTDARTNCLARGAGWDLAAIRDEATNEFLTRLVPVETWIGASDAEREGIWTWVSDGTPFWSGGASPTGSAVNGAYANWAPNEPDGIVNGGGSDAQCVIMMPGGTWDDQACRIFASFVCEGP